MSQELKFPKGFYWGAASASYQVEGGIENNDWADAARKGRVPVMGIGPDHYNLFEKDFDLIKSLGHNSHRMSIEWSRIEPEEGQFDQEAIEHYRKVILALHERGIEPFVTLWHFTIPLWLAKDGGILSSKFPTLFARYCDFVTQHLGEHCTHWVTMNEPNVISSNGFIVGAWPPFKRFSFFKYLKSMSQLKEAHIMAYNAIKNQDLESNVGIVKDNIYVHSSKNPFWYIIMKTFRWHWNFKFLNSIRHHIDSIGLNYYFHYHFGLRRTVRERTDMGWEIYPEGVYYTLMELKKYGKPVFVAEAGIADEKDKFRARYIKDLIYWIHKAIEDGVPVKGYMYWSIMDNYEWAYGFRKRFGLIEIDYNTKERKIRPSAYEYKKICESNTLIIEK